MEYQIEKVREVLVVLCATIYMAVLHRACDALTEMHMSLRFRMFYRFDPDSALYNDLKTFKEKEGKDYILLNFTFKVRTSITTITFIALNT